MNAPQKSEPAKLDHVILVGPIGAPKWEWARQAQAEISPRELEPLSMDMCHYYRLSGLPTGRTGEGESSQPCSGAVLRAPFRAPHHSVSEAGLRGKLNGCRLRPGELLLAHGGIFFMDEPQEYRRDCLATVLTTIRAGRVDYESGPNRLEAPCRFRLIVSAKPCPCGFHGAGSGRPECRCLPGQIERHRAGYAALYLVCREVLVPYEPRGVFADVADFAARQMADTIRKGQ